MKEAKEAKQGWFDLKKNTSVYITGLPDDATEAEVGEAFGKCGIIKEDDERKPRVKVYRDPATGRPKGDGLVTYLREPSVGLALQLLDSTPLRYGLPVSAGGLCAVREGGAQCWEELRVQQSRGGAAWQCPCERLIIRASTRLTPFLPAAHRPPLLPPPPLHRPTSHPCPTHCLPSLLPPQNMSVSEAKLELKGPGYVAKAAGASKKVKKRKVESQEKALGWHGFDDRAKPTEVTVVIRRMFDPGDFAEDPFLREELDRDVTAEAAKLGTVEKVGRGGGSGGGGAGGCVWRGGWPAGRVGGEQGRVLPPPLHAWQALVCWYWDSE